MTVQPPEDAERYKEQTSLYDPELDDPDDDATGYENDADGLGDDGAE